MKTYMIINPKVKTLKFVPSSILINMSELQLLTFHLNPIELMYFDCVGNQTLSKEGEKEDW